MHVQAAVTYGAGSDFSLADIELEDPRPDEILVRTAAVGLCHSDLTARQYFPGGGVLGHEGAGVVEVVGSAVTGFAPGDHVVLGFDACGSCRACLGGRPYRCRNFAAMNYGGARPDGSTALRVGETPIAGSFFGQSSFASHCLATARNAVKVDPQLPLDKLAPLGCGVITGSGTVLNALRPFPGSSLVVFGAGSVGLSALLGAVVTQVGTLIAVDIVPGRLELARTLGATHVIDGRSDDVAGQIRDLTDGGADYAVETSGAASVVATAVSSVPEGGTVALVGLGDLQGTITLSHYEMVMGRTVMGVTEGNSVPQVYIPQLIDLWRAGRFPFDAMITAYPFDKIGQAVADSEAGRTVKAVLTF
ncbi:MAG: NAD(P)-dependent alcohol dehydrogenase [Pseudonocardia sp.]|nr:NAD(P)-dependent alcohol dehydrogenase [Pseudonocardia sp.]